MILALDLYAVLCCCSFSITARDFTLLIVQRKRRHGAYIIHSAPSIIPDIVQAPQLLFRLCSGNPNLFMSHPGAYEMLPRGRSRSDSLECASTMEASSFLPVALGAQGRVGCFLSNPFPLIFFVS
ncbi:hypothetical protein MAP00_002490 [Monascus purpureus]|nr:hypothetical protein MAP00_002490 [Monascus purpureus]